MPNYICATCGTQFAATDAPPAHCPICEDERQYIGWKGQQWTTLEQLRADHRSLIRPEETHLTGIRAGVRHRPAGAARPVARRQYPVGLHHPD